MSESAIVRGPRGGVYLVDDEGNREWFPSIDAALRAEPRALVTA